MKERARLFGESLIEGEKLCVRQRPPLLSVVITCFNYETFIVEAIDSVLAQNCPSLEIIVVDDGSTDQSWEKIQTYKDQIIAVRTENRGALRSSLTGFSLSKGDFVYFLDADDLLCLGAINLLKPYLRANVSKIQFMLLPIDKSGNVIGHAFPRLKPSDDSGVLIESIIKSGFYLTPPTSGNVYRRNVYEELGDLSYERAIDGVAYLLAPFVGEVISIDKALAKYRIHSSNLSAFSDLSGSRMNGYIARFLSRLQHLEQLIHTRGINGRDFCVRKDYAYVLEMTIMGMIAERRRPNLRLVRAYVLAVAREYSGAKRKLLLIFGVASIVFPVNLTIGLVKFRIDQSKNSWIRTKIKTLLMAHQ